MSDNPFRDLPEAHYAPRPGGAPPANPLLAPAIFLLVLSLAFLLLLFATLPRQIIKLRDIDTSTPHGQGEFAGAIVTPIAWILAALSITVGSISMLRLKGYRSAFHAAILASIPFCSPCFVLGIPFGIWAVILLRRPEVRDRFA
jgi:hypothetical protein